MDVADGTITRMEVIRGAPCGATWEAATHVVGLAAREAVIRIGLKTQFFCMADPSGWDPIYGTSPVHFAREAHKAALKRAVHEATFVELY